MPTPRSDPRGSEPAAPPPSSPALAVLPAAALVIAVTAVHWPALSARAVTVDDHQYLHDNYLVLHPGRDSVRRFLTEVLEPSSVEGYYQPLAMISLMLDTAMGGRPDHLRPYHRTSLALHAANVVLVFLLIRGLLGQAWIAAAVALLFGLHPMTVEPIPWIGERKTLLAAFFSLLTLLAYARYARAKANEGQEGTGGHGENRRTALGHVLPSGSRRSSHRTSAATWYTACAGCLVLALLSKPTATPLPILLLVLDYWPLGRLSPAKAGRARPSRIILEKLPLLAISALSAAITVISQGRTATIGMPGQRATPSIPLVLGYFGPFYLSKIAWPLELSAFYRIPQPFTFANPTLLLTLTATLVIIAALALSLRWTRAFVAGAIFFVMAILPTTGVITFTNVIASDKYAYLPIVGPLLTLAWCLGRWIDKSKLLRTSSGSRVAAVSALVAVLAAETALTRRQLGYWQTTETLYGRMLELTPDSWLLYQGLGVHYADTGDYARAITAYEQGLRLDPNTASLMYNIGNAHLRLGQPEEAMTWYERALRTEESSDAHNNLGHALTQLGRLSEAITHYQRAIELRPRNNGARNNLAVAFAQSGRLDEAIAQLRAVLELAPENPRAWGNLGSAILESGRPAEAITCYERAVQLDPAYVDAWANWGEALYRLHRFPEAAARYRKALELRPDHASARERLAELATRAAP